MRIKLILISIILALQSSIYAKECVTRIDSQCQIDAKQVWIDSGKQYTCEWIPDTTYPYYGICILVKANPPE